jgi:hypothetical protein
MFSGRSKNLEPACFRYRILKRKRWVTPSVQAKDRIHRFHRTGGPGYAVNDLVEEKGTLLNNFSIARLSVFIIIFSARSMGAGIRISVVNKPLFSSAFMARKVPNRPVS